MSKTLLCLYYFSLFFSFQWVAAQNPLYNLHSYAQNGFVAINNYEPVIINSTYVVTISGSGPGSGQVDLKNWKLAVIVKKAINPRTGPQNKPFPADKIALRPNSTFGALIPGPVPTVSQIGMTPVAYLADKKKEVFLVPKSNAAIVHTMPYDSYYVIGFNFDLLIDGGAYLGNLYQSDEVDKHYYLPLEFVLYNEHGIELGRATPGEFEIRIFSLKPNQLSIKLTGQVLNGALAFQTLNDYAQGITTAYPASMTIASNTAYEVRVKSLQQNFSTDNNQNSLPLNSVQLSLQANAGHTSTVTPRWLSTQDQVLASGASTNNVNRTFDVRYNTKANDALILQSPSGVYKTILQYQIIPK